MNILRKAFYACAAVLLFCSAAPKELEAQTANIGFVDFKKCVEQSKLGKQEQANFESMKKQMEDVLGEKEKSLSDISTKFDDPDYLDTLSPEAEAEMKHKFRNLNQELSQHQQQYYQILNQANFKIIQKISETINEASKTVAKDKSLDIILNEEGAFYYKDTLDVSADIVKVMDATFKPEETK
ncbi:MAG: hypothetical protein K940chlam7_00539 [Chlamydiae bacterium]|nr:hypothetical protein [Chlamydiota bacterium]